MCGASVLCLGCARVAVARLLLAGWLAGWALAAGCWLLVLVLLPACLLVVLLRCQAASCTTTSTGGGLARPLHMAPPQTRQGHFPRYDRMRNLNGFTQRQRKKMARAGILSGGPGSGNGKSLGVGGHFVNGIITKHVGSAANQPP